MALDPAGAAAATAAASAWYVGVAIAAVVVLPFAVLFRALAIVRAHGSGSGGKGRGGIARGETMYLPQRFALTDVGEAQRLMRDIAFGELITVDSETLLPYISHIPFNFISSSGRGSSGSGSSDRGSSGRGSSGSGSDEFGRLQAHIAVTNPQCEHLIAAARAGASGASRPVVCAFNGANAYVSPHNYSGQTRQVPTWNYTAVHAVGHVRLVTDAKPKADAMAALVTRFERDRPKPWPVPGSEAEVYGSAEVQEMLQEVMVFEVSITRLDAKIKLSQNRSAADWHALHTAFRADESQHKQALAHAMTHFCPHKFAPAAAAEGKRR